LETIIFILSTSVHAQLNWNIYTEGGFFNSKDINSSQPRNLLFRMDGNANYFYSENDISASAKVRVRPEFYGFDNNFKSLKFKASGDYYKKQESMDKDGRSGVCNHIAGFNDSCDDREAGRKTGYQRGNVQAPA